MSKFLIDSDIIIWTLRGKKETIKLLEDIQQLGAPVCSPISIIEVQLGVRNGEEEKTLELLDSLDVCNIDRDIANLAGEYIRDCKKRGIGLEIPDAIIAASCVFNGLTLVTYNKKHYPIRGLKIHSII